MDEVDGFKEANLTTIYQNSFFCVNFLWLVHYVVLKFKLHRKNLYFCTVFVNENDAKITNKVNLKK